MNLCLNLGCATFLKERFRERSSRRAIWVALTLTGGVASLKANYVQVDPWLALIPIWVSAAIHFLDPDVADLPAPQPAVSKGL